MSGILANQPTSGQASDYLVLKESVAGGDIPGATAETRRLVERGTPVGEILDQGLVPAMDEVGAQFAAGDIFIPQMLLSAKTMQECMKILEPLFKKGEKTSKGKVLIGTVQGDLHDIGKNLVAVMLEGAGFGVIDLGVDVKPETFVRKALELEPDIVAMSALLSTTMPAMSKTIKALREAGLKDKVKVMIGGAPVTEKFAAEIEADLFAPDAGAAVGKAKEALGLS
ncbi:MAG: corrinoid protein [Pseudomonadota bacterium]